MPFLKRYPLLAVLVVLGATAMPASAWWAADFDSDSDVDLADFAGFAACFNGPNRSYGGLPHCPQADFDRDSDVDLADFAIFAACFNGPNRVPACPPQYTLTVNIIGSHGTCVPMSGTYTANTVADLLAQPDPNYQVKAWTGTDNDSLTTNDNTVTMTGHKTVTLEFESSAPSGMVLVPAGEFLMGDHLDGYGDAPVHAVYVDAFHMDRYEVTKQLWDTVRAWGLSNGYTDLIAGGGKAANHPVHSVNWFDCVKWANARSEMEGRTPCYYTDAGLTTVYKTGELAPYVKWDANGYRLPTEAEWEKAARGGAAGRRFPWSDSDLIQHARANYYSSTSYSYDTSPTRGYHPTFNTGSTPYTSPVGYFAPNGYGLYDMAGNVWELCNDWYGSTYYSSSPYDNPTGPASGTYRVLRGGSWGDAAYGCRVAYRDLNGPAARRYYSGFRCAAGT